VSRPRFLADNDLNEQIVGPVIDSLILIWSASEAEEWSGQVLFLPL
jgi:hypothetical protein